MMFFAVVLAVLIALASKNIGLGALLGLVLCFIAHRLKSQEDEFNQLSNRLDELKSHNEFLTEKLSEIVHHSSQEPLNTTPHNSNQPQSSIIEYNTSSNIDKIFRQDNIQGLDDTNINDNIQPIEDLENQTTNTLSTVLDVVHNKANNRINSELGNKTNNKKVKFIKKSRHDNNETDNSLSSEFDFSQNKLVQWFINTNPLLKIGMIVLFLGFAFLLKFVSTKIVIPVILRYLAVGLFGLGALLFGIKRYDKKPVFSLAMQGFGIAVMYLTTLAALKLHGLVGSVPAFVFMVLLMALLIYRAMKHDSQMLAQISVVGAMAVPILTATGSNAYVLLFSYLLLITMGVAIIASIKAWRSLNISTFFGVVLIAYFWSPMYQDDNYLVIQAFLLAFWLLFNVIVILYAKNSDEDLSNHLPNRIANNATLLEIMDYIKNHGLYIGKLDSSLLFGAALIGFYFQYSITRYLEYGSAIAAFGFAVVYLLLGLYANNMGQSFAILRQALISLCLVFITIGISLLLDGNWLSSTWAIQAALLYVFAMKQQQPHFRVFALALFFASALLCYQSISQNLIVTDTLLLGLFVHTLAIVICGAMIFLTYIKENTVNIEYEDDEILDDNNEEWYANAQLALWENNTNNTALIATLGLLFILPMLIFGYAGSMVSLTVIALLLSVANRYIHHLLFSVFVMIANVTAVVFLYKILFINYSTNVSDGYASLLALISMMMTLLSAFVYHRDSDDDSSDDNDGADKNVQFLAGYGLLIIHLLLVLFSVYSLNATYNLDIDFVRAASLCFVPMVIFAYFANYYEAKRLSLCYLLVVALLFLDILLSSTSNPFSTFLLYLLATLFYGFILYYQPNTQKANSVLAFTYKSALIIFTLLWTWYVYFKTSYYDYQDYKIAMIFPSLFAWEMCLYRTLPAPSVLKEPLHKFGAVSLAVLTVMILVYLNWQTPYTFIFLPLPYLPIINPLGIIGVAVLFMSFRQLPKILDESYHFYTSILMTMVAFFVLNTEIMRLWYFYGGVAWELPALLASFGVQSSLSLVWALSAIVLMVLGNRRAERLFWLMGAALMSVVVIKLFLVDLGNSGGVARIVSFIGVGLLLLVVGYFAPVPPKKNDETAN
ncbi:MAG: DUF2339 domain-containing protein [Moraxella sp.]|nr:DUF2339 domain-containing protein [Moraxella sp.]